MTIADWLVDAMTKLKSVDIPNGRREALILLSDLLDRDKSWIHAHPEIKLDNLQVKELERNLNRRLGHIPLAYIRGFAEFYGRKYTVNSNVLIPRPESESFIDIIKDLDIEAPQIADIGTGSGCLGITAALELPNAIVDLYDIDVAALAVADHNTRQYGLNLRLYKSDLLSDLESVQYDIILANLPYVPDGMITSLEITKEPEKALFSGKDGLDHYRRFWQQISRLEPKSCYVLTESLEKQHQQMTALAKENGYRIKNSAVLVQIFEKV